MWKRFYPNDRIEWYDGWPSSYSLTGSFQIQRVVFPDDKGGPI